MNRMELVEDRLHGRVALESSLGILRRVTLQGPAVAVLLFLLAFVGITAALLIQKLPPDWYVRFDCWWRLLLAEAIFAAPAIIIGKVFLTGAKRGPWEQLAWDPAADKFTAFRCGSLPFRTERVSLPLTSVETIHLRSESGRLDSRIHLTIDFTAAYPRPSIEADFSIAGLDRRDEATDFLERLGRAARFEHYVIDQSGARTFEARLVRSLAGEDRDDTRPIASEPAAPQYHARTRADEPPPFEVFPFSPEVFGESFKLTHLLDWRPGERIRFHRPPPPAIVLQIAAGLGSLVGGIIGWFLLTEITRGWLPAWSTPLIGAACGAAISLFSAWRQTREREVIFEWSAGQLTAREAGRTQRASIAQIQRLLLCGDVRHKSENDSQRSEYRCRLVAVLPDRQMLIVDSDEWYPGLDAPAQKLVPLAAELASQLNVLWTWQPPRE